MIPSDYPNLLGQIKERIRSAQYAALKAVNEELIRLYWDIGRMIVERQQAGGWGKSIVEQLARDLQAEFPGIQASLRATSAICGSFGSHTTTTQNCNHWLQKSGGRTT